MSKCIFCGTELVEGKCPNQENHFKPMCINCMFCNTEVTDTDDGKCFCENPDNKEDAVKKIKEAVPSGYEIEDIKLKPLPLKDETKKCKRWKLVQNFREIILETYK